MNLAFRGRGRTSGRYVAEQYDKTLRFWELIAARDGFECLSRPESNILCFRYGRDSAAAGRGCASGSFASGRFHLSSTEVNGERWLRMTRDGAGDDEETIEELLDAIEEARRDA